MEIARLALSVREAAQALGVSDWLIREECRRGRLYHIRIGGRIVIPVWALEEYIGMPLPMRTESREVPFDS